MIKGKGNASNNLYPGHPRKYFNYLPTPKSFRLYYLLFLIYLVILCLLLQRASFIKKAGITGRMIFLLFLLKVFAGIVLGWLSLHYYSAGSDYWDLNRAGWEEYQLMRTNPHEYLTNIFRTSYSNEYGGLFDSFQSFWNDLKNNLVIKLLSVFNIFSQGNYYINSMYFNYLIFFGHVALYRVFIKIYPGQTNSVIAGCFLLPSLLYFSSGIHRDGVVFLVLSMLVYTLFFSLQEKRITPKQLVIIFLSIFLLFVMRIYLVFLLIPGLLAWIVTVKMKWLAKRTFPLVYLFAFLFFFQVHNFLHTLDPLQAMVQKQRDYFNLPHSVTGISVDSLYPSFKSFLKNAPQAMNHVLLRPYLPELPSPILLPLNFELFLYQLLFLILFFFRNKNLPGNRDPLICFGIFFTLTVFLFIGYIVPNLGTLVRYRSIYLPFIITPLLCNVDFRKLSRFKILN